jgi:hypothetical protein
MSKQQKQPASPEKKRQIRFAIISALLLAAVIAVANVRGLVQTYYECFVFRTEDTEEAVSYLTGLSRDDLTADQLEALQTLQSQWDSWRYSRLRDDVTVTAADDVTLHGALYNENSDITAIFIPRYDGTCDGDFLLAPTLNALTGCNVLAIDPRAHGESGGEAYTFGALESADLTVWMDWAEQELGTTTFLLYGEGSGANTILTALTQDGMEDRTAFVVAESAYASFHETADYLLWNSYHLPAFPFLTLMESKFNSAGFGVTTADLELADRLATCDSTVPVLFLSSAQDSYIPPEYTDEVCAAYPGEKQLYSGGTSHGTVLSDGQAEIQSILGNWCAQKLG